MKTGILKKTALLVSALIFAAAAVTACGSGKQEEPAAQEETLTEEEQQQMAEEATAQTDAEMEAALEEVEAYEEEILSEYTGEMDLSGSWDDEVSQRASMDVTKNEDGSYDILVHWGSSAYESSIWEIHGTYDEVSGMLSYEDGKYSVHTWDQNQNETISGEEITTGVFLKEGEKLRWQDSKAYEDGLFVKAQ